MDAVFIMVTRCWIVKETREIMLTAQSNILNSISIKYMYVGQLTARW